MMASTNHGSKGRTSRDQWRRPRCHQKITSNAAGSVAMTVFVNNPKTKNANAAM
jgi:hypothetical protein